MAANFTIEDQPDVPRSKSVASQGWSGTSSEMTRGGDSFMHDSKEARKREKVEKERLSKLFFPRFVKYSEEYSYAQSVIGRHNLDQLRKIWVICNGVLALNWLPYYLLARTHETEGAWVHNITCIIQESLCQLLLVPLILEWRGKLCPAFEAEFDSFMTVIVILGVISLLFANRWRTGVIFFDDPLQFLDEEGNQGKHDVFLLLCLIAASSFCNFMLYLRPDRALIVSVAVPLSYLLMSIRGLSPHSTKEIIEQSVLLSAMTAFFWHSQRQRDVRTRLAWLHTRKLQTEVSDLRHAKSERHVIDNPGDVSTPSGKWVEKWVGRGIRESLADSGPRTSQRSLASNLSSEASMMEESSGWYVNASPFDIILLIDEISAQTTNDPSDKANRSSVYLRARSFKKANVSERDAARIQICRPSDDEDSEFSWGALPNESLLTIERTAWSKKQDAYEYDRPLVRLRLPSEDNESHLGWLKCVQGPNSLLLFTWSPPGELRGMPLKQFEQFLEEVIEAPGQWECEVEKEDGSKEIVMKGPDCWGYPDDAARNMYDACKHMINKNISIVDASYAEVRTDFGPPEIFGSHVWGETAENTLKAVRLFVNADAGAISEVHTTRKSMTATSGKMREVSEAMRRIWFSTCCNNQTRILEEIGTEKAAESHIARVIDSPSCTQVLVISPQLALARKWCTFEFGLGIKAEKTVILATTSGSVEDGQVPPKDLQQMARYLKRFSCAQAGCKEKEDQDLIDNAIKDMGGYERLDAQLRTKCYTAIRSAHGFTTKAMRAMKNKDV